MTSIQAGTIKTMLEKEGAIIRNAHFSGAGGSEVVLRRTELIDRTLCNAYDHLTAAGPMPALLATGGYGRGELNPHSDIDIMFLCRDEQDRQRSLELLYVLWDAGMDVGYSVRTMPECVSLARQDIKIRTSLLESRLIAGDPAFYDLFIRTMQSGVFYWKPSAFIQEKIAERVATRRKYGGSIYLREPNIKECEGGLRDIHTALWIAFVRYRVASLGELVAKNVITGRQYAVFQRSRNFLWRLRNEIHYLSGRKNDHLTFDLQERAAKDFKYRDSAHLFAVERFMKAYFLHARNIREFTDAVVTAVLGKPSRKWFQRAQKLGPFSLSGRTLFLSSDEGCHKNAVLAMTAFEIAQNRHAVFSDQLGSLIGSCRLDDAERISAPASNVFLTILNNPDGLSETLALMKDLRFLGRYIPEFRAIQALARHDYYHLYTVDEHILLAIKNLQALWSGSFPSLTTLSDAFRGLSKRWVLILALLLHDLGKAYRNEHEHRGVELAKNILMRLSVTGVDCDRILFLIENHLVMALLSQRRELSDRKVIADFSRLVQDRENLSMLYLLTYADISAVNPTSWTQWKAALLQDLYLRTLNHLDASAQTVEEERARLTAASDRIKNAADGQFSSQEIDEFIATMPEQYLLTASTRRVLDHLSMMKKLPEEQLVIRCRHDIERGYTELTVCAYDAYGMFYRTAGTIASKNLNILRAQVFTSKNGVMIDTFQITGPEGKFFDYEEAWESVRIELRAALMSGFKLPEPSPYACTPSLPVSITPAVTFDNETSEIFTIIDITARDCVGFLYHVSKALYDLNLDIGSAKIVTEGSRVMDSFYVTNLFKKKIDDAVRLEKIRETLMKVIG
ncbi:MAG: [protein-PII] uridylyltransferase [Nitrospirae bacterium]|nr:[protein-PII] uridylyltransferase [Nitrospirota bacterium]